MGARRKVDTVSQRAQWYKAGHGLVPIRWVFVHDGQGTHRDEYFFTTAVGMPPKELIERYTGRWSLETTFQELRASLGLETTGGGPKRPCYVPSPVCLASSLWSPCSMPTSQSATPKASRYSGSANPMRPSQIRSPRSVAGSGAKGFLYGVGITTPLRIYPLH